MECQQVQDLKHCFELHNLQLSSSTYFPKTHDYSTTILKYLTGKSIPRLSSSS